MATALDTYGYSDLRSYIQSNWNWIAVVDDDGTEQLRWDVAANGNASWTSGSGSNPLTAELVITGQDLLDAGTTLPVTLTLTESYKSSSATSRTTHDSYTDATIEADNDEVTITHSFSLPP